MHFNFKIVKNPYSVKYLKGNVVGKPAALFTFSPTYKRRYFIEY